MLNAKIYMLNKIVTGNYITKQHFHILLTVWLWAGKAYQLFIWKTYCNNASFERKDIILQQSCKQGKADNPHQQRQNKVLSPLALNRDKCYLF